MPSQTVTGTGARRQDRETLGTGRKVRARAPLRLGLAGGGTDVSPYCDRFGGLVLNATIDRYCHATIEERSSGGPAFGSRDQHLEQRADDHLLHEAVWARLQRQFDLGDASFVLTTISDAPPGSGLGSSSTLVVAIIEAFREFFSLPLDEYEIARLAFEVERVDCGMKGGRQDQYAATFGGFNMMEFYADDRVVINQLRLKDAILRELEASIVLFHTGVTRRSASIIDVQSSHIAQGHERQVAATHALRQEALEMKEALLHGDLQRLAVILRRGWEAKKELASGVSSPALEAAFDRATASGALAGKVSGAGGGGYVLFIAEPLDRPELVRSLRNVEQGRVEPVHFVSEGAVAWTLR